MGKEHRDARVTWAAILAPVALSALVMTLICVPLLGASTESGRSTTKRSLFENNDLMDEKLGDEKSEEGEASLRVAALQQPMPSPNKGPLPAPRRRGFSPPIGSEESEESEPDAEDDGSESLSAEEMEERRMGRLKALDDMGKKYPRLKNMPGMRQLRKVREKKEAERRASVESGLGAAGSAGR